MKKGSVVRVINVPAPSDKHLIGKTGKVVKIENRKLYHVRIDGTSGRNPRFFADEIEAFERG